VFKKIIICAYFFLLIVSFHLFINYTEILMKKGMGMVICQNSIFFIFLQLDWWVLGKMKNLVHLRVNIEDITELTDENSSPTHVKWIIFCFYAKWNNGYGKFGKIIYQNYEKLWFLNIPKPNVQFCLLFALRKNEDLRTVNFV